METSDNLQKFAARLRGLMSRRGLKIWQVAERLNVSTSAVQSWRDAKNFPKGRPAMRQLAEFLQTTEGWLYGDSDISPAFTTDSTPANASIVPFGFTEVPPVGAAAAGAGRAFEDIEGDDITLAEGIRDPNAIAVLVEGDSMEPDFHRGQRIVVDTKADLQPGKPVVLKDLRDNVYFKDYFPAGDGRILLKSRNPVYPDLVFSLDQVRWVYKAHGTYIKF